MNLARVLRNGGGGGHSGESQKKRLRREENMLQRIPVTQYRTPYKVDLEKLEMHRDLTARAVCDLEGWTRKHWRTAVNALSKWNDPATPLGKSQLAALHRLQELGKLDNWTPGILFKTFFDLDELLFRRTLYKNVALKFIVRPEKSFVMATFDPGPISRLGTTERVLIGINVPYVTSGCYTVHDAFAVMIHEMM